jgi:hypothetical protein
MGEVMTGYKSKRDAALDEEGMYLVHQTEVKTQYPSEMYDREREQQIKAQSLAQPAQEPVQVSVEEFVHIVEDKEHLVGRPIVWAQWPSKEKNND